MYTPTVRQSEGNFVQRDFCPGVIMSREIVFVSRTISPYTAYELTFPRANSIESRRRPRLPQRHTIPEF